MKASETLLADFITRWSTSGGNELANAQLFLAELCDILGVTRPAPATTVNEENVYSFERKVFIPRGDGTAEMKRLDLYKQGCFVLEAKQGKEVQAALPLALPLVGKTRSTAVKRGTRPWEDAMVRAKRQAESYVRSLPAGEGRPPFIIVSDVGYCFDIYSEFSRTGGMYIPFPDARTYRVFLRDLPRQEVRDFFRAIWEDPLSLDPSRRSARVTEAIARILADLARSLEEDGQNPEEVAAFLMRCLFSMFAEDVGLLPASSFQHILDQAAMKPELLDPMLTDLWRAMNAGTVSVALGQRLRRFNGNIFARPDVLPLTSPQIALLAQAAKADWREVEPAIFGTLLERALDPRERQKLGAHYTPRAYVERLVLPTVVAPLREDWQNVQAAASLLAAQEKGSEALRAILEFHRKLCAVRVLDPACGSGNFLYVTLEHLKRLEGEVLTEAATYGEFQQPLETTGLTVDPHQLLGLEANPRAAHIAEMVLWIGYLQWHYRTHGSVAPPEPIIRTFHNIRRQDAVLAWKSWKYATDSEGKVITRWDGRTRKTDPATGREVPDEAAQVPVEVYEQPHAAEWPEADYIVGNPPFIGNKVRRIALGSGYVDALTAAYPKLPESCDFVMYWWHKAAELTRTGKVRRFGFITTNSLTMIFNRRIVATHLEATPPLYLAFAIPDHPWVDSANGAAVRIAMTVGTVETTNGILAEVTSELAADGVERHVTLAEKAGRLHADLTVGVDIVNVGVLKSNEGMSCRGVIPVGKDFIVSYEEAVSLGLGRVMGIEKHIRPYRNGRDVADIPRGVYAIDLFGLAGDEVKRRFPEIFQWILERVKPERDQKRRDSQRNKWWVFAEPRATFRPALAGLSRYVATVYVAKHCYFVFMPSQILPDDGLVAIASDDAYHLAILSSRFHVAWALATGGRLGVGNDPRYNNSVCFSPFPFPDPTPELKNRIRDLGERLDAHRKARQALHPTLTLTGMYNVLQALREGKELTEAERTIKDQGLVSLLREIHDELDSAVAEAYGWPSDLGDQEILARLVALNAERAAEEAEGTVRWLRPDYQCRNMETPQVQGLLDLGAGAAATSKKKGRKQAPAKVKAVPWPSSLPAQVQAVRAALASLGGCVEAAAVAKAFKGAQRARVQEVLATLESLGYIAIDQNQLCRLL